MTVALNCQTVMDEDLIPRFVRGALPPDEAERLEAHCFACDACWTELQTAMALNATLEVLPKREVEVAPAAVGTHWSWQTWGWLAAAATLVVAVGVGTQLMRHGEPPVAPTQPPAAPGKPVRAPAAPVQPAAPAATPETPAQVERSPTAGPLAVTVKRQTDGAIQIAWLAVPGAALYHVGIFTADGRELLTRDTDTMALVISRRELAALPPKADLVVQVEARDVMGTLIARSQPAKFVVDR